VKDGTSDSSSEDRLLEALVNGDEEAFAMLVVDHEIPVRRTVGRLLGYTDAAIDDLVQEVFLAAWRGRRHLRERTSFAAWLQSIAIRRCRSHVARRARRRRLARFIPLRGVAEHVIDPAAASAGSESGPSVDPLLERALAHLSHDHREVIVLHHLEGMTAVQIGTALGLRPGAVDARLHRARRALREILSAGREASERERGPHAAAAATGVTP
jgi:RNA polymerase sigma-70 factor (ECF subfamily)